MHVLLTEGTAGEIMSFHVFGKVIVILNSAKATKELFERRGEIYSDRPAIPIHEMYVLSRLAFVVSSVRSDDIQDEV